MANTEYGMFLLLSTVLFISTFYMWNTVLRKLEISYPENTSDRNVSIFMGFESSTEHEDHIGFRGQELYTFATSKDIIIGYNYANVDKHWFVWFLKLNHLSSTQFYWIQQTKESIQAKYMLNDTDFIKQISLIISTKIINNECDTVIIRPGRQRVGLPLLITKIRSYFPSQSINNAVITAIADKDWMEQFGTKACLHRYIDNIDKPSLIESVHMFNSQNDGLTELKGYICRNKNEVLTAFDMLTKQIGHSNVVVKDCDGDSGSDVYFYKNKQELINDFVWRESFKLVTVEQDLRYSERDHLEIDRVEFVGISFYDNEIIVGGHQQIMSEHGTEWIGSEKYTNKIIEKRLKKITKLDVMDKIGTRFTGGFDFAVQIFKDKNVLPKIYLIDINTGRTTGTCQTFILMKKFDMRNKYFIRYNAKIKSDVLFQSVITLYPKLLFDKNTKKGVYFHTFYSKRNCAIVSIFGDNKIEAYTFYEQLRNSSVYEAV